ncbi:MAG: hypothetical protein U0165_04320 [Polyangiaceae bacterium]
MKHSLLSSFVFAAVVGLSAMGCAPTGKLDVPASYAKMPSSKTCSFKAANAKGVVVAVRTQDNDLKGNADFWAESIDQRMREQGYDGDTTIRDVQAKSGLVGKQMRYSRTQQGREYRYWLTVFVADSRVFVVEAGGDKETFDPATTEVENAVASFYIP